MTVNVQPFVLDQHEQDFAKYRELRPEEVKLIAGAGGTGPSFSQSCPTGTSTPDMDGGDDGSDED